MESGLKGAFVQNSNYVQVKGVWNISTRSYGKTKEKGLKDFFFFSGRYNFQIKYQIGVRLQSLER